MIHYIEEEKMAEEIVKNSQKLMIVNFFADWCMPCQILSPVLNELDKRYQGVEIYKVNVDESPNAIYTYNVSSIPTMVLFKSGEEVERIVGFESLQNLSQMIESFDEVN